MSTLIYKKMANKKLEQFITDNGLTFQKGSRNTDSTVLSGYALHIGITNVNTVINSINTALGSTTDDYKEELKSVFSFAKSRDYGSWWNKPKAKEIYKF